MDQPASPSALDRPRASLLPPVDWTAYQPPPFQRDFLESLAEGDRDGDDGKCDVGDAHAEWHGVGALPAVAQAFLASAGGAAYRQPTECQRQLWPVLLAGCDALCVAPTGSGKSLAFLVPALVVAEAAARRWKEAQAARAATAKHKRGPTSLGGAGRAGASLSSARAALRFSGYSQDPGSPVRPAVLVLAPTRELAQQLAKVKETRSQLAVSIF
jgi:hypothetical protein